MAVAGCSKGYASTIRKGTYVPHVATWLALAELVGVEMTERDGLGAREQGPRTVAHARSRGRT